MCITVEVEQSSTNASTDAFAKITGEG